MITGQAIPAAVTPCDGIRKHYWARSSHWYGYTMDTEETLTALGYTTDEVLADARLRRGLEKATAAYFARNMRTGLR